MIWHLSHRYDPAAVALADRHYSRQKVGTPQFVPPGRNVVLLTGAADAVWVTSWPYAEFTHHEWGGAWVCSIFRNEGPMLSSALILEAVAATRAIWPDVPALGMVTFVDPSALHPRRTRRYGPPEPGRCFRLAGFERVGVTRKAGLLAFRMRPEAMPEAAAPHGWLFNMRRSA